MPEHSHKFIDQYTGLVGFGFDRPTDEATVQFYLQKFSDDECMAKILPRLEEQELADIFELISLILKRHLTEEEYHSVFLKDHRQEI